MLTNVNPFLFNESIFSSHLEDLLKTNYDKFAENFYHDYMNFVYLGEHETTVAYPKLLDNLELGVYQDIDKNLDINDKRTICAYLRKMVEDEYEHVKTIKTCLIDNFAVPTVPEHLDLVEYQMCSLMQTMDFENLLIRFYIGECYAWTAYYLIYKNTQDLNLKKIFHKLVVDETHHNNNIYKALKKLKTKNMRYESFFINETVRYRYFGLAYVTKYFGLTDVLPKKANYWIKTVYNTQWHLNFNKIFVKKCFQLYKVFHPEINFDDFFASINKNELDWNISKS